ncbi:GDSL-type esterase/lipase family protein [Streptomyces sp. bgisy084]|uniref:GDSL-type esterase/lipase family protein n=1 Tax=Streptomyces sp. bgisy084 TaxID=3413777 RepID=UPI003D70E842
MRRIAAVATGSVLALSGMLLGGPPSASGQGKPPAVVSLGDSFISGEAGRWQGNGDGGNAGSRFGTDRGAYSCNASESWCWHDAHRAYGTSYDNKCNRSGSAEITHVERVRVAGNAYPIAPEDRVNISCSGATTDAIYKTAFKLERVQTSQLYDLALKKSVKLVVLSVGGNDIQFSDIIETCAMRFIKGSSPHCNKDLGKEIPSRIATMEQAVKKSVEAIRGTMSNAGYQASDYRLVLQTYPSPIPAGANYRADLPETNYSRATSGGCPFYNDDSDWADGTVVSDLADAHRKTAEGERIDFLDLRRALQGHEVCSKSTYQATSSNTLKNPIPAERSEWVRWAGYNFHFSQGNKQEYLHPNYYGQQKLGDCLNVLASGADSDYTCPAPAA